MRKSLIFMFLCNNIFANTSFNWNTTTDLSEAGNTREPSVQIVSNDLDEVIAIWSRYDVEWLVETSYSEDDGEHWFSPATAIDAGVQSSDPLPRVAINDNDTAIAVFNGSNHPFYSPDGGQSWTASTTSIGGTLVLEPEIALQGENHAIVCWTELGGQLQSAYSSDGGVNWTNSSSGDFPVANILSPQVATNITDEGFVLFANNGIIQGFYSTDGGANWDPSLASDLISQNLSTTTASHPKIAMSEGMAVAVWKRLDGVLGRTIIESIYSTDSGASWSDPQVLSDTSDNADNPRVSLNDQGDTIVVWESQHEVSPSVIQYAYSFDGGLTFSSHITLSPLVVDCISPDVSINDDGVAAIVYIDSTDGVILTSSSVDAGVTLSSPVVLSSINGSAGNPSVIANGQDYALVAWPISISSEYTVQSVYGNFFNLYLTQEVKELLFQRDYVNRIFCDLMPDASLYRVYSDPYLTQLLYEGEAPEFFDHGQKKGERKTYYMTWADQWGEESSSADISTP